MGKWGVFSSSTLETTWCYGQYTLWSPPRIFKHSLYPPPETKPYSDSTYHFILLICDSPHMLHISASSVLEPGPEAVGGGRRLLRHRPGGQGAPRAAAGDQVRRLHRRHDLQRVRARPGAPLGRRAPHRRILGILFHLRRARWVDWFFLYG